MKSAKKNILRFIGRGGRLASITVKGFDQEAKHRPLLPVDLTDKRRQENGCGEAVRSGILKPEGNYIL